MDFNPERFVKRIVDEARRAAETHVAERVASIRCREHPETRVVAIIDPNGGVQISGPTCCDSLESDVLTALNDLGATPSEVEQVSQPPDERDPQTQPLAFISHSSADKERIARPIDGMLRERGIRTWLDERDLLPGKNLVDEIFEHGISQSDAFIAVLSANSIDSKWVHEELTNAVVQRINGAVKIVIPVIVDGIKPPSFLDHLVWEVINDVGNLPVHADRIAASIVGRQAPPVAPAPAYAGIPVHRMSSLTPDDERIFAEACGQILRKPRYSPTVSVQELVEYGKGIGMSEDLVAECVAALEQSHYFSEVIQGCGEPMPAAARISHFGFEQFLEHYMPTEYRAAKRAVIGDIVNQGGHTSSLMAHVLGIHETIVEHILTDLEYGGHVIAAHHNEGISVHANPTLRRVLQNLENDSQ